MRNHAASAMCAQIGQSACSRGGFGRVRDLPLRAFLSAQVGALVGGLLCMGAVQLRVLQVHSSNSTNATAQ